MSKNVNVKSERCSLGLCIISYIHIYVGHPMSLCQVAFRFSGSGGGGGVVVDIAYIPLQVCVVRGNVVNRSRSFGRWGPIIDALQRVHK